MAEPVTLQTLLTYLTLISIPVGVVYHIMTLRNTRRNQQMQLETRQAQLFMQIYDNFNKTEFYRKQMDIMREMEWGDTEDYERKYGGDLEAVSKVGSIGVFFEGIGVLAQQGLIDVELVARLMSGHVIGIWEKLGPVWKARRERSGNPYVMEYNEWLYNAVKRVKKEQKPAYLTE